MCVRERERGTHTQIVAFFLSQKLMVTCLQNSHKWTKATPHPPIKNKKNNIQKEKGYRIKKQHMQSLTHVCKKYTCVRKDVRVLTFNFSCIRLQIQPCNWRLEKRKSKALILKTTVHFSANLRAKMIRHRVQEMTEHNMVF